MSNDFPENVIAENLQLVYGNDRSPGFRRIVIGDDFTYIDNKGDVISDSGILERIKRLGIPPAWRNVWICSKQNGHIQAVGKDEKGRKQYRYHIDWIEAMQQQKFDHMIFFSEVLPKIRQQIDADMRMHSLKHRRVLATVVWLLEHTFIRIGNTEYARENKHFGLTTLRNRHVNIEGDTISFAFVGKSGKVTKVDVAHPRIARTIRQLEELPGYELFQYLDDYGSRHSVSSQEVNDYLREIAGEQISAKEFRTWGGTVLAGSLLYELGSSRRESESKRNITKVVKTVSTHLHNTPTICRSYYIHPLIPETYQNGMLNSYFEETKDGKRQEQELTEYELAVAKLLREETEKVNAHDI